MDDEIRIVVTREMLKRLLRPCEGSVSSGVSDVVEEFSERVGEDVLEDFIKERR